MRVRTGPGALTEAVHLFLAVVKKQGAKQAQNQQSHNLRHYAVPKTTSRSGIYVLQTCEISPTPYFQVYCIEHAIWILCSFYVGNNVIDGPGDMLDLGVGRRGAGL